MNTEIKSNPLSKILTDINRNLRQHWVFSLSTRIVLLTATFSTLLIIWKWKQLPEQIPFWYYQPWGSDRLAPTYTIFLHPIITLILHLINTLFAAWFLQQHRVFAQIMFASSIFIACFALLAVVKVVFLFS